MPGRLILRVERSEPAGARSRSARLYSGLLFLLSAFLSACAASTPSSTPQLIPVYSTFAAEPWLSELYECAASQSDAVLARVDDPAVAAIGLRVGEPEFLSSFAYQIAQEDLLIVTQRQSPIQNLTPAEARALFAGQGDPSVQVWVYPAGSDLQRALDQLVMEGRSVTPSAQVAITPQQLSDTLVNQPNTVGLLPRHWKAGDSREVLSVGKVPVLAVARSEPQGLVKDLLLCLQQ